MTKNAKTPAKSLLPLPSILEKLKRHDPMAPQQIMDRAEEIQRLRRAKEKKDIQKRSAGSFFRSLTAGFNSLLGISQRQRFNRLGMESVDIRLRQSWAMVGNDMRTAILEYLDQNGFAGPDYHKGGISFTAQEVESLKTLTVPSPQSRFSTHNVCDPNSYLSRIKL